MIYYNNPAKDEYSLKIVNEIRNILYNFTKREDIVLIVGSLARGEFCKYSDIDVTMVTYERDEINRNIPYKDREMNIMYYTFKEFEKCLENPLFSYITFKHPAYILQGEKKFYKYKEKYFTDDLLSKREKILNELSHRIERWGFFVLNNYRYIKEEFFLEMEFRDFLHAIKKFLYYANAIKEYLQTEQIPIRYEDVKKLGIPNDLLKIFDYEPDKQAVIRAYSYVVQNIFKLIRLEKLKDEFKRYIEIIKSLE